MADVNENPYTEIERRRKALGWSMRRLAREAGVRPETVASVERGGHARGPHRATVMLLDWVLAEAEKKR